MQATIFPFRLDQQYEGLPSYPWPSGCLLGHPRIRLDDSSALSDILYKDLDLKDLEDLAPRLWLMSKQDSTSISPLHRQQVKGRQIIISEDPRLHLVWHRTRIFIKPLPAYLLSHDFWKAHLDPKANERLFKAACGLMRTYFYLVQYESDFRIAERPDLRLLPGCNSFEEFCSFSSDFQSILDSSVSQRYSFGELRLSRLNMYSKVSINGKRTIRI